MCSITKASFQAGPLYLSSNPFINCSLEHLCFVYSTKLLKHMDPSGLLHKVEATTEKTLE